MRATTAIAAVALGCLLTLPAAAEPDKQHGGSQHGGKPGGGAGRPETPGHRDKPGHPAQPGTPQDGLPGRQKQPAPTAPGKAPTKGKKKAPKKPAPKKPARQSTGSVNPAPAAVQPNRRPQRAATRRRAAAKRRAGGNAGSGSPAARRARASASASGPNSRLAAAHTSVAGAGSQGSQPSVRRSARHKASTQKPAPAPTPNPQRTGPVHAVTRVIERVPTLLWVLLAAVAALAVAASAGSILAGLRARRAERQRREVMEDVGLLQAALLPPVPSDLGALQLSAAYRPADGPAAGGDFYDAFPLPDGRAGFVIGDVSGHGRGSLAQTAVVRFTVRAYLEAGLEPRDVLKLSQSVLEDKFSDDFVTVMLASYDPTSGRLTYAGAGHPPPLVRGPLPTPAVTAASAPLIGAGLGTGLRQTTVSLAEGTTVCLYTDGLVEAMVGDRMLGRNKLAGMLDVLGREATADKVLASVVDEADRTGDDMAVCVARVATQGATDPTPYLVEELEVSLRDLEDGIAERFLRACGIYPVHTAQAQRKAYGVCEEYGAALLSVHRHEHPQRVEVTPASVEGLVAPASRARAET